MKESIIYNKMLSSTGPLNFNDFINDKYELVHRKLFIDALYNYWYKNERIVEDKYSDFINKNKIIEIRNENYSFPSKILIISKRFPYTQKKVDLSDYWNEYQFNEDNKDISELLIDQDIVSDAELIYIDYTTNRAKFRSKLTGKEFWSTSDYINQDTIINTDEMTLDKTFTQLINNRDNK